FVMPHQPDSIASKTYAVTSAGIALGSAVKLSGIYESGKKPYSFRGLINHEIGHVLGLRHTWSGNDGCEDTPNHRNCWNRTKSAPCDTQASNNLMDYNAKQHAWTPCQIGTIHLGFAREGSKSRRLLVHDWCHAWPGYEVIITETEVWEGAKDLAGDIIIKDGGQLTISNRVSLPEGAKIVVEAGGELILGDVKLHNACGLRWQGIEVTQKKGQRGQVTFLGDPTFENVSPQFLTSAGLTQK
ncbi:MAG: hypothetical protein KTR24_07110, partial [Saprospiraceae bacterium]|nr:hypothetical protein [Saprospiraceae bacterium]